MAISAALVFAGKSVETATISFLVTKAFNYLDEYCKSEGMEEVRNQLVLAIPKIQAVFDVVNPERIREQSSAMDAWLWQLRDAVEEAEDAIDELEYFELEEKAKDQKVSDWGSSFAKMKHKVVKSVKHVSILDKTVKQFTHHGTLKRLRKAVDSLDKAAAGVAVFLGLTDHLKGVASSIQQQEQLVNNDRQTGSTLSATKFVGREKEKEQIIGWLTKTSVESAETVTSTNSVPIISVVGHGGMGKTTLAQSICEEDEVLKHFKIIWATVSTSFDATSVTSKILECVTEAKPSANHLEPLQQDLKEKLLSSALELICRPCCLLSHSQYLSIRDGSEMESLPEWWLVQNRSSLQSLTIREATSWNRSQRARETSPLSNIWNYMVLGNSDFFQICPPPCGCFIFGDAILS